MVERARQLIEDILQKEKAASNLVQQATEEAKQIIAQTERDAKEMVATGEKQAREAAQSLLDEQDRLSQQQAEAELAQTNSTLHELQESLSQKTPLVAEKLNRALNVFTIPEE